MKRMYKRPIGYKRRLSEKLSVPREYAGSPKASQITYALLENMRPSFERQLKLNGIIDKIKEAEQEWLDEFADSDNEQEIEMNVLRDIEVELSIRGSYVYLTFSLVYNDPLIAQFKYSQEDWNFWCNEGYVAGETICKEINKIIKNTYPEITVDDGALDRWERANGYIENYYVCYINTNKLPTSFIEAHKNEVQIRESYGTRAYRNSTLTEHWYENDDDEPIDFNEDAFKIVLADGEYEMINNYGDIVVAKKIIERQTHRKLYVGDYVKIYFLDGKDDCYWLYRVVRVTADSYYLEREGESERYKAGRNHQLSRI